MATTTVLDRTPVLGALTSRPRATALTGAFLIAFSAPLVRLADVTPSTAAVFRCLYAVPPLLLLARLEDRRLGPRTRRARTLAAIAGALFAIDLVAWHHAIDDVGAGLATVLGNLQVVFVPVIAFFTLGERPGRRLLATLPLMLLGIVLISGTLESGAYGENPAQGVVFGVITGLSYAGFILVLRAGSADVRRPAGPLSDATVVGAAGAALIGLLAGELDLAPSWPAHGWLVTLALTSQVMGWMLLSAALPRLPATLGSLLLMIQPVGSVVLGVLLFGEAPSALQLAGVAAVLAALLLVTWRRTRPVPPER